MALAPIQNIGYWKAEVVPRAEPCSTGRCPLIHLFITAQISLFELNFGSAPLHYRPAHIHPLSESEFFGTVFKTGK
jgi:hypothetical protein